MNEAKVPHLVTPVPGPEAQAVVDRSQQATTPSLPHAYPLVARRAQGVTVEDVDGNLFLDCAAGIAVCSTGYCHPRVVEAIQSQASRLIHICAADFYDPLYVELAERLGRSVPGNSARKVFLGNSGTEAIEAAFKLARYHTGRPKTLAFFGGFHGRTMAAVSLTASNALYHRGFGPLVPGITHMPYAYCYRCSYNLSYPTCDLACVDAIEEVLFNQTVPGEEVAAIFVEAVQGEGGYIVPPPGWLARLRSLCDRYGILLVADEVQSGMGRTGKMFAFEHFGVAPDILCIGKSVGGGFPMAVVASTEEIMSQWESGAHGTTFGGHPVAAAAALAQLKILTKEGFLSEVVAKGDRFKCKLIELQKSFFQLGDVRGIGLMNAIEIVGESGEPDPKKASEVRDHLFSENILVLTCGLKGQAIRFIPPLNIDENLLDNVVDVVASALA